MNLLMIVNNLYFVENYYAKILNVDLMNLMMNLIHLASSNLLK